MKPSRLILPFASILLLASMASLQAATLHVSPAGNDANPGTAGKPFGTLAKAQSSARSFAGKEAVTVVVHGGTFYLNTPLVLTAADSGSKLAPVHYEAAPNEKPVISGGVELKLKWEPYKDGIMRAQVPAELKTEEIFVNGERQTLARYPNVDPKAQYFDGFAADAFSKERAARWANPAGGYFHAMHPGLWGGFTWVITGKDANGEITKEGGWQNNRGGAVHEKIRFVENLFEELDARGEWFLDRRTHLLYFYPPAGLDLAKAKVEATRLTNLVELRGSVEDPVRGIVIKGLTFRHANRTVMETKEPLLRSDWAIYRGGAIFFNGAADCMLDDAVIDQVGGNAVFVNNYNRRITIRGCEIVKAGASGVVFLGDYQAARNPLFNYNQTQNLADIDRTAGAKSDNYPADCLVDDCLIHLTGRVEKQTAGVNIDLAQNITIRHCSIYDMPRAGINIGDGCWGGHIIEFCDVFDTVKETGDHGSFNSWGRDRFWKSDHRAWEPAIQQEPALPYLDAMKPTIIRNSRWRCDHGWDIDLDDGSTNYHIYNNLCLNGGLKSREGFGRVVENNILIGGFHPHVWYDHSEDIVRRNIMSSDQYHPAGNIPEPWGKEIDYNLVHRAGVTQREPATKLAEQSKRDAHSIIADAMFIDAATGDFRVKPNSPALKLGFVNFPMDRFGVQNEQLKASARTPEMPKLFPSLAATAIPPSAKTPAIAWSAKIRNISGMGERSAYGLPDESGVLLLEVPAASPAAKAGLTKDDVIVACDGKPVHTVADLLKLRDASAAKSWSLAIIRKQKPLTIQISSDR